MEAAMIACEIEANPSELSFVWKFNNTSGMTNLSREHYTVESSRSVAKFVPVTELDYGSLSCWAKNELGAQHEPCVYRIIPAGKYEYKRYTTLRMCVGISTPRLLDWYIHSLDTKHTARKVYLYSYSIVLHSNYGN